MTNRHYLRISGPVAAVSRWRSSSTFFPDRTTGDEKIPQPRHPKFLGLLAGRTVRRQLLSRFDYGMAKRAKAQRGSHNPTFIFREPSGAEGQSLPAIESKEPHA